MINLKRNIITAIKKISEIKGFINTKNEIKTEEINSIVDTILLPFPFGKIKDRALDLTVRSCIFNAVPAPSKIIRIHLKITSISGNNEKASTIPEKIDTGVEIKSSILSIHGVK